MQFKFAYFSLFLTHLELKRQILSQVFTPIIPLKTIPGSKMYTSSQTKKAHKPYPLGKDITLRLI